MLMPRWLKFQWGPVIAALIGAGLMAALASGQDNSPVIAPTDAPSALHGVVAAAWDAIRHLVDEGVHKITLN
jgi:hypothetical protein